ncbi:hypothetical protein R4K55_13560 [Brachyspira alvinipulli]|uniref:hypothetical protein n=1 Tax=Brachyspira alvinipulli TaxID=84379 RepID=UPI00260CE092|nr:hypothetical protein [uncultured Brachyspira sp.]
MNKKLLTIFLSLFLVGILSVSCSNNDKTGSSGIEQYNGNTYVSEATGDGSYIWISIKNGKVGIMGNKSNTSEPSYLGYMNVTGSGTDYKFWSDDRSTEGTLKFTSDGSSVTGTFTKNETAPGTVGQPVVCNKKQ